MIPQVLSLIQRTFTGAARGKAMSAYAAVLAGGVIVGQIAGGLLISADLFGATWRPVFLVNVPIGAVLLAAGWRKLPAGTRAAARGLDRPGLLTLSPAVLALVVPLVLGQPEHWPVWGWAWLAGSAVLFAGFARIEGRLAARGGSPLVPGRVLRLPGAGLGIAALFAVMTVFGGFFFALALHLQGGLGDSPLRAGPTFAPSAATFAAVSLNWQRLPARARPWLAICGFAGITVALLTLARILDGGGSGGAALYLALALLGGAMAAAFSPLMTAVLMRVPAADAADAAGVIVTVNQLGLVIGVATFGTLYLNLAGSLPAHPGMAASGQLSAHAAAATCVALAGGGLAAIRAWTACADLPHRRGGCGRYAPRWYPESRKGSLVLSLVLPKGSLERATLDLFDAADLTVRRSSERDYHASIDDPRIERVRFLRPQEIPSYLEQGLFDLGITGRDWIEETGADVTSLGELQYSKVTSDPVRVVLAVPAAAPWTALSDLPDGIRISTEFPALTRRFLDSNGVKAIVIPSYGATEAKVPDIVDAIVDLTETGSSLRRNGLRILETVLTSYTELVANPAACADPAKRAAMEDVALLLRGAIEARGNVLLKLNVPAAQLAAVTEILPSMSSPTITSLARGGMNAVEAVVPKRGVNTLIPALKSAGARDILEIPISKIVE
jgi:ATP phosphoribosyltransferase